ncbi:HutD family protein [Marinomonas sp. 5E14-1]|uniref:HutD/Ves family protein n=1 Tax=Marinomonas sp. 5E14-1 TaxID=3153922 RepID=UPI003266DDD5
MTLNSQSCYQVILQDEYKRMPWKNGLGETLEIYRAEDADGLRFRISQASVVEDGIFSDFSGLHRTLVLLSGDGMTLAHQSQPDSVLGARLDMASFFGGDETHATLHNSAIEDLNIMVRETDTKANVIACINDSLDSSSSHSICEIAISEENAFSSFYANQACEAKLDESQIITLPANSTLVIKQTARFCLVQGSGALITVEYS